MQDVTLKISSAGKYRLQQFYRCVSDVTKKAFSEMTLNDFVFVVDVRVLGGTSQLDTYNIRTHRFRKSEFTQAVKYIGERMYQVVQSNDQLSVYDFEFTFQFAAVPTGRGRTFGRDHETI